MSNKHKKAQAFCRLRMFLSHDGKSGASYPHCLKKGSIFKIERFFGKKLDYVSPLQSEFQSGGDCSHAVSEYYPLLLIVIGFELN